MALIFLISLISNSQAKILSSPKGSQQYHWIGFFFGILVIVAGLLLIQIVLIQGEDFLAKKRKNRQGIDLRGILIMLLGVFILSIPLIKYVLNAPLPELNMTTVFNRTWINQTYHVTYYNQSMGEPGNPRSLNPGIYLYAFFGILAVLFVYFGMKFYLGFKTSRKKKKLKEKLEAFDRKLQEEGIEFIGDPRDIVVKLYKNAILWLEVLGIPYKESWTHWEHAQHVKYKHDAYVELARLFEKAKYAPEKVTMGDAKRAYELYLRIKGDENEDN